MHHEAPALDAALSLQKNMASHENISASVPQAAIAGDRSCPKGMKSPASRMLRTACSPKCQPSIASSTSLQTPGCSAPDRQPPQAASDNPQPILTATAATTSSIADDAQYCSKIACSQVKAAIKAADATFGWAEANMHTLGHGPGCHRVAAFLEQSKRHRSELEAHLHTLDYGLKNCKGLVVSMGLMFPPELVTQLLHTGDEPLLEQEDDAAWQAARKHLQMHPHVSGKTLMIMDSLQGEMEFIKSAKCNVQGALAILDHFDRSIGNAASSMTLGQKPHTVMEAGPSAAENEPELRRSTTAAAAPVQAEADKAAAAQKQAKNAKKNKAKKKSPQPSSQPADNPTSATALPAGQCALRLFLTAVVHV